MFESFSEVEPFSEDKNNVTHAVDFHVHFWWTLIFIVIDLKAGLDEEEEVTDVVCVESHLKDGE